MDNMLIAIIGSSVILIGVIVFSAIKIQNAIKLLTVNIKKTALEDTNNIINEVKTSLESILKLEESKNNLIENSILKINDLINTKDKQLKDIASENQNDLLTHSDKLKASIMDVLSLLTVSIKKYQSNNTDHLENNYHNIARLVNNLRLENLINVSNEVGKYRNGIVEDEYFLQEVGFCKIVKLTDKKTNEVTKVFYNENGQKSSTQTYLNTDLKYEMEYKDELLFKGLEYNANKQVIFAYTYDEAGEIASKTEYKYDESGNRIEKPTKTEE